MGQTKVQKLLHNVTTTGIDEVFVPLGMQRTFQLTGLRDANYSYLFDGSTKYITIPRDNSIIFSDNFSVSAWVKPDNSGSGTNMVICSYGASGDRAWYLKVGQTTGDIFVASSQNGSAVSLGTASSACTVNEWNHVGFSWEAGIIKFYCNGALVQTHNTSQTSVWTGGSHDFKIAAQAPATPNFKGEIDEVGIHNTVLQLSDFIILYNGGTALNAYENITLTSTLAGYWRMGENLSGTTEPDETANGNDGVLENMTIADRIETSEAGVAVVDIEVSNDGENFLNLHTMQMDLLGAINCDSFYTEEPWKYVRANVTSISGSNPVINLYMGNEGY